MSKLIKMVLMVAGVIAMLGFAGCRGDAPEAVVEKLLACTQAADFEGAVKYYTGDWEKKLRQNIAELEKLKETNKALYDNEMAALKEGVAHAKVGKATIDGDEAKVAIVGADGKKSTVQLVKVGWRWKIKEFKVEK